MKAEKFLEILHTAEQLKNNTRHSWTSSGRQESVAEHSWRLCMMAYFAKDEFPDLDMERVLLMCLFHDMGEAFTGDIPAFEKTEQDSERENRCVDGWLAGLPRGYREELTELFGEMERLETPEARLYKAFDKMEAVIQHNEAPIGTWLPLEYQLQFTYGTKETSFSDYTKELKAAVDEETRRKIGASQVKENPAAP